MKKLKLRGWMHFFSTIETPDLGLEVLKKAEDAEVEHGSGSVGGFVVVYYSQEGMCIFEVLKDDKDVRVLQFISTAA